MLQLLTDFYIFTVCPKLLSQSNLNQLTSIIGKYPTKSKSYPKVDSFVEEFFTKVLPSSTKLQSNFSLDHLQTMSRFYLSNPSTRLQRVQELMQLEKGFFIETKIQSIVVCSGQFRSFIDQLLEDPKSLTVEKLTHEQSKFTALGNQPRRYSKHPGLHMRVIQTCRRFLTTKQQNLITKIILHDYLQDREILNVDKLKCLRVLRSLPLTYHQTMDYLQQDQQLISQNPNKRSYRNKGAASQPLDDVFICLPATFDLNSEDLLKHLQVLKVKVNASSARFVSNAMLSISRKLPDQVFLNDFLQFLQNDNFLKSGITANKELLRLLNQYKDNAQLIPSIIQPFWEKKPHQDIRICLVILLLRFLAKSKLTNAHEQIIFHILEEAANEEYLPMINAFFTQPSEQQRWPLTVLKNCKDPLYEKFVRTIQWKILDHPTSLQARVLAWKNIDYHFVETDRFIEKIQQLALQFDKQGNALAIIAFGQSLSLFKDQYLLVHLLSLRSLSHHY